MSVGYHIFEYIYRDKPQYKDVYRDNHKYKEKLKVTYSFNLPPGQQLMNVKAFCNSSPAHTHLYFAVSLPAFQKQF